MTDGQKLSQRLRSWEKSLRIRENDRESLAHIFNVGEADILAQAAEYIEKEEKFREISAHTREVKVP